MQTDRIECAFCGAPGATDTYREDLYPDAPCCADEDACYSRMVDEPSEDLLGDAGRALAQFFAVES